MDVDTNKTRGIILKLTRIRVEDTIDSVNYGGLEVPQVKVNSTVWQFLTVREPNTSRKFGSVYRASFLKTVDTFLE